MYVTVIYYCKIDVGGIKKEVGPFNQFKYKRSIYKLFKTKDKVFPNMEYYVVEIDNYECHIPSYCSILEDKLREGKDKDNKWLYEKMKGKKPKDWKKELEERTGIVFKTGRDINGASIKIPKKRGSKSVDKDKLQDSNDSLFEV